VGIRYCSRRELLKQGARAAVAASLAERMDLPAAWPQKIQPVLPKISMNGNPVSESDDKFLEELEHASFRFFWDQTNPATGIVRDRCNAVAPDRGELGSIAATGFGLTALCIGDKRGYVTHAACGGARSRRQHPSLSVEENAEPPRVLLSLGQHKHRRATLGLGGFLPRHGHFAVRNSDVPATLSSLGNQHAGLRYFQPHRLDLAFRGHQNSPARLDA